MTGVRFLRLGLAAVCLSVLLVLVSAVLFTRSDSASPQPLTRGPVAASEVATSGDLSTTIASLQSRLQRLPSDSESWAALGAAYVQQARITGDPSYYPKAAGVLARSLKESPTDNAAALTGEAALAAARHDFQGAYRLTSKAMDINSFNSATMAIQFDALIELGRYNDALRALKRYAGLKPGVPAYTRISYNYELHGNLQGARYAMRRALDIAYSPDDRAFALFELGELAWNAGRLAEASSLYRQGWRADPTYVANLYGLAKTDAGLGRTDRAVRRYQDVINRLPQPTYIIEYADLLTSLGRTDDAAAQGRLIDAQQRIFRAAGVNLDLELALYDASHGRPARALEQARQAWHERRSIFVEDAYAWALHVNGHDRVALRHLDSAERLGTRSALFAFHRGMVQHSLGHRAAAASSLREALAINPAFNPVFAAQARQALQALTRGN